MAKLITFIRALFNCCTCHGLIPYVFTFLFMHRLFENQECSCNCSVSFRHILLSDSRFNRGKKKIRDQICYRSSLSLPSPCKSHEIVCYFSVIRIYLFLNNLVVPMCVP